MLRKVELFQEIFEEIKNACREFFHQTSLCNIQEINLSTQKVTIHYRGKSAFIKASIEEVIGDSEIIKRLSPSEACLLGSYHGRALRAAIEGRGAM